MSRIFSCSFTITNHSAEADGKVVSFRARIHTLRRMSAKLVFIVFRQQTMTIQGVLQSFRPVDGVEGMFTYNQDCICFH
jgi:aspartyl/asparaginyl-tRNA synthetase